MRLVRQSSSIPSGCEVGNQFDDLGKRQAALRRQLLGLDEEVLRKINGRSHDALTLHHDTTPLEPGSLLAPTSGLGGVFSKRAVGLSVSGPSRGWLWLAEAPADGDAAS